MKSHEAGSGTRITPDPTSETLAEQIQNPDVDQDNNPSFQGEDLPSFAPAALLRIILERRAGENEAIANMSAPLAQLLHSDAPTAVSLRKYKHPRRAHKHRAMQSLAAHCEEILANPARAESVFMDRKNIKLQNAFKRVVSIVGQARKSALDEAAESKNHQLHSRAKLQSQKSSLNKETIQLVTSAAAVLTVAGELEYWDKGALSPTQPDKKSLFQLETHGSKLHIIDLADPVVAIQLALNAQKHNLPARLQTTD